MNKCSVFMEKWIKYIAVFPMLLLTVLTIIFQNTISFDAHEVSTVYFNGAKFILLLLLSIPVLYTVIRLLKYVPENVLFAIGAVLYLVVGCYLITHIQMQLRHDSGICYWNALNYVKGNFTYLQKGDYFYMYPHQLGLASYDCLLVLMSDNQNLVFFVNLLWILLADFFAWRTMVLLYADKPLLRKIVLLLSFLFLPNLFYIFYAYTLIR